MPRLATLLAMRSRVRQQTDQEQSAFVTDGEIDAWINQGIAEVWRLLTTADSNRGIASDNIVTTSGTTEYALPSDFMAIRGLDYPLGGGRYADVHPYAFAERNQLVGMPTIGGGAAPCRYLVFRSGVDGADARISLLPDPGDATLVLWYVAVPPLLVSNTDDFDGIIGFEDYAVYHAAAQVRIKAEEDMSAELMHMQKIEARIKAEAPRRNRSGTVTIARVRNNWPARPWPHYPV